MVLKKRMNFSEKAFLFSRKKIFLIVSGIDKRYYFLRRILEKKSPSLAVLKSFMEVLANTKPWFFCIKLQSLYVLRRFKQKYHLKSILDKIGQVYRLRKNSWFFEKKTDIFSAKKPHFWSISDIFSIFTNWDAFKKIFAKLGDFSFFQRHFRKKHLIFQKKLLNILTKNLKTKILCKAFKRP